MDSNSSGSNLTNFGIEKLVGTNYNYWRLCMEAFLQGDLWDLVDSSDSVTPQDIPKNVESRRKWKIKCGKALFVLRMSVGKEHIDHIRDLESPKEVWKTLERLFTKKNTARLQLLENKLARLVQGENMPTIKDNQLRWRNVKCYRCGKLGHSKRNCSVKLGDESANVVTDETYDQLQYEQCLSTILAETQAKTSAVIPSSINFEKEWVIDFGYSHHVTGNDSLFSELHQHLGDRAIVTADNSVNHVEKEVSQITDSGKYVLFGPKGVKILENVKNIAADVLLVGEKKDYLFVMSATEAYVERTSRNDGVSIWHARLGHVGYQMLQ
ncbi:Retrovirus-related Pol polyprotein from transposon TNT 1-94 [Quillaja saponaria]|uniref:Retrovirus-related Pol polyprotein from transposon TNT 1-94 n=1 Tax=Quillaja saponaria TaxID=32244 RepID=A0AAD7PBT3_QUISA|nr:Retrovirus-related Pol polyprotein from transposon TNT 1-94 [Quillaja saponaria]